MAQKIVDDNGIVYGTSVSNPAIATVVAEPQYQPHYGNQVNQVYSGNVNAPPPVTGPPEGRWRDGICDCFKNLWPTCGCVFIFDGCWIMSQMADRTGFTSFSIIRPFLFIWVVCFFVSLAYDWVYVLPGAITLVFSIMLRFHLLKKYHMDQNNKLLECCTGFFCFPCSIAQMARHVYGYNKVFDGDSDPALRDRYSDITPYTPYAV